MSPFAKRFPAGRWSFLGLGSETKVYSINKDQEENWIESLNWWKNYRYTSVPMVIRLKLFLAQLFLLISSVSTEQSSDLCEEYSCCQTRTGRLVVAKQSNPLFAPADLLIMALTPSVEILAQENLLQKYKERVGKAFNNKIE